MTVESNIYIICNAMSDTEKKIRSIVSDSPASTRKVLSFAQALRTTGRVVEILSLGRGKSTSDNFLFKNSIETYQSIKIEYLNFINLSLITHVASMIALSFAVLRIPRRSVLIYYNRHPIYFLSLIIARIFGHKCYLDLEDADQITGSYLSKILKTFYVKAFDLLSKDGVILANSKMDVYCSIKRKKVFYGVASTSPTLHPSQVSKIHCIYSGTVETETGAALLYDALKVISDRKYAWYDRFVFEISGNGSLLNGFSDLKNLPYCPEIVVHGRLTRVDYDEVLQRCSIGLSLKLVNGPFADTTFPSKVIEYASNGLALIATDISDLRSLLLSDPFYVLNDDPLEIVNALESYVNDVGAGRRRALNSKIRLTDSLSFHKVGAELNDFLRN